MGRQFFRIRHTPLFRISVFDHRPNRLGKGSSHDRRDTHADGWAMLHSRLVVPINGDIEETLRSQRERQHTFSAVVITDLKAAANTSHSLVDIL